MSFSLKKFFAFLTGEKKQELKPEIVEESTESKPVEENTVTKETVEQTEVKEQPVVSDYQIKRMEFLKRKKAEFDAEIDAIPRVEISLSTQKINRRLVSELPEITFRNITRSTVIDKLFPLVVIDVETTGIKISGNYIVEVSAIKYDVGFVPVSCFTTLLKPRRSIPEEATAVNGITDEMVKDCPQFYEVVPCLAEFVSGCNIVGHNLSFDLKFLFVSGLDLSEKVKYFDTLDLAKKVLKKPKHNYDDYFYDDDKYEEYDVLNYKLETLCDYYSIYRNDAHRSLSDCLATAKVFQNLISDKTM